MCKSPWCDRPSLAALTAASGVPGLFTAPDRDYCCPDCRHADEGGWHERDDWGDDADHGYSCTPAVHAKAS